MAHYIRFAAADGSVVLVEVEAAEMSAPAPGVVKAGLADTIEHTVASAQDTLEGALQKVLRANVEAFIAAIQGLSKTPTDVEITFGLKATGEAGNVAIGKITGEVNYTVKLMWKSEART